MTTRGGSRGDERKIYLAGPDVFLPDAIEAGRRKVALCWDYGFRGLYPLDSGLPDDASAAAIYRALVAMMEAADAGIFHLTPYRGPSADVGTAFELGAMAAMGKPVFAYSNDAALFFDRVKASCSLDYHAETGAWRDGDGMSAEDFGLVDNLMIDGALAAQGRLIHRASVPAGVRFTDLGGFRACLEEARAHFSSSAPGRDA